MINPSVLMLDEPTGVSPVIMDEIFQHIVKYKKTKYCNFNG